ncbi:antifreeze protein [Ramaria rubella]|nr:antifreeze protein [Ramaria rubella]
MSFKSSMSLIALGLLTILSGTVALGPAPVLLRSAGNFTILAKSGISTVPKSVITGNIGVSPAAATALTGFSLTLSTDGTHATSTQIVGNALAADFKSPTPSVMTTAIADMGTAHTDAAGRVNPDHLNLDSGKCGILAGVTLAPGLYKFSTGVLIASSITLSGSATDTWIFQIAETLTMTAAQKIILAGGALPANIVWVVAGATTFEAGAKFEGVLLGATSVALQTGTTMNGRILSQTAVTLQMATVTKP